MTDGGSSEGKTCGSPGAGRGQSTPGGHRLRESYGAPTAYAVVELGRARARAAVWQGGWILAGGGGRPYGGCDKGEALGARDGGRSWGAKSGSTCS